MTAVTGICFITIIFFKTNNHHNSIEIKVLKVCICKRITEELCDNDVRQRYSYYSKMSGTLIFIIHFFFIIHARRECSLQPFSRF